MDEAADNDIEPFGLSAFAVRMAEDRQVVGIFVAEDLDQLAHLVDQCTDPSETEYLRLRVGGVYVGARTEAQWPAREITDEEGQAIDIVPEDANPLNGAEIDDYWWLDMDRGDWLPLAWENALPRRPPSRRRRAGRR